MGNGFGHMPRGGEHLWLSREGTRFDCVESVTLVRRLDSDSIR